MKLKPKYIRAWQGYDGPVVIIGTPLRESMYTLTKASVERLATTIFRLQYNHEMRCFPFLTDRMGYQVIID